MSFRGAQHPQGVRRIRDGRIPSPRPKAFPLPGGRCPRRGRMRVGIVGCGGHRTGGWGHPPLRRVTIDFVGAAVLSGPSITGSPPWSPSSVMAAPCHLLPCGAKALAVPSGALRCRWRSPHPSRLTPCHLPPGEGFLFLTPGAGAGADMIRPDSPHWASPSLLSLRDISP